MNKLSCRVGISASALGRLVNMNSSPLRANMEWKDPVMKLSEFFGCLPEDLFEESRINNALDANRARAETEFVEVRRFIRAESAETLSPENIVFENERAAVVAKILGVLTPREKKVIRMRFGFDGEGDPTLEEVGKTLGVTRECIRQNEERAIRKLRHYSRRKILEDLRK